jgi:hypothetical protein
MLNGETMVAVRCQISRSGFSSERVFRITLPNGGEYVGAGPVEYFFDENRRRLAADQPAQREVRIPGFVAGRVVTAEPVAVPLLSLPSGDVVRIGRSEITEYPGGSHAHVPVQS